MQRVASFTSSIGGVTGSVSVSFYFGQMDRPVVDWLIAWNLSRLAGSTWPAGVFGRQVNLITKDGSRRLPDGIKSPQFLSDAKSGLPRLLVGKHPTKQGVTLCYSWWQEQRMAAAGARSNVSHCDGYETFAIVQIFLVKLHNLWFMLSFQDWMAWGQRHWLVL